MFLLVLLNGVMNKESKVFVYCVLYFPLIRLFTKKNESSTDTASLSSFSYHCYSV